MTGFAYLDMKAQRAEITHGEMHLPDRSRDHQTESGKTSTRVNRQVKESNCILVHLGDVCLTNCEHRCCLAGRDTDLGGPAAQLQDHLRWPERERGRECIPLIEAEFRRDRSAKSFLSRGGYRVVARS